jgi:hypothetical protein
MKKASRSQASAPSRIASAIALLLRDFTYRGRAVLVAAMLLGALLAGSTFAWRKWSAAIGRLDQYVVTADRVHLSPPPPWLKANIAVQALEDAGLSESLSLIDPDLASRLVEALELHPWVTRVKRVETHIPPRVDAEVVYREPFAAVEAGSVGENALCPIDVNGFRLPANDIPAAMLVRLPRISDSGQLPLVGQPFRGPRTAGAIEIVSSLRDQWESLSLWIVSPQDRPETYGEEQYILYDIIASGGTRIHWGTAPNAALEHESPPEQKLSRLRAYLEANNVDLRSVRSPAVIDVRRDVQVKRRMAALPNELKE